MQYEVGEIDFGMRPGERLTAMSALKGRLYVFTNFRTFEVIHKSRFRIWIEQMWRKIRPTKVSVYRVKPYDSRLS